MKGLSRCSKRFVNGPLPVTMACSTPHTRLDTITSSSDAEHCQGLACTKKPKLANIASLPFLISLTLSSAADSASNQDVSCMSSIADRCR